MDRIPVATREGVPEAQQDASRFICPEGIHFYSFSELAYPTTGGSFRTVDYKGIDIIYSLLNLTIYIGITIYRVFLHCRNCY